MEEEFVIFEPQIESIGEVEIDEIESSKKMFKTLFFLGLVLYFFTVIAII